MTLTATFIVLSIMGVLDAGYLLYQHLKKKPLICPLDHDCSVVTESKWSNFLGIRNEFLGVVFYILVLSIILASVFSPSNAQKLYFLLLLFTGISLLFSVALTFVQIFAIKDYCFYCVISAVLTFLLFINSVYLLKIF